MAYNACYNRVLPPPSGSSLGTVLCILSAFTIMYECAKSSAWHALPGSDHLGNPHLFFRDRQQHRLFSEVLPIACDLIQNYILDLGSFRNSQQLSVWLTVSLNSQFPILIQALGRHGIILYIPKYLFRCLICSKDPNTYQILFTYQMNEQKQSLSHY